LTPGGRSTLNWFRHTPPRGDNGTLLRPTFPRSALGEITPRFPQGDFVGVWWWYGDLIFMGLPTTSPWIKTASN
jgi:hypothetical protein